MSIIHITAKNFETEVLKMNRFTVVLFWAPWSPPSRELLLSLIDISDSYAENVRFVALNVDRAGELSEYYGVHTIPTMLYFWKGKEIGMTDGLSTAANLEYLIEKILKVYVKAHEIRKP